MVSRPRVSVIVAAYNVEDFIEQAVMSALSQTVQDVEVIVVDDGSTDGTVLRVREISDERLRLFQNETNLGPSRTRNSGLMQARGHWVAVLDADDWWASDRLEILLKVAEQESAQIVCDDLYLVMDGSEHPWNTYLKSRERVIGVLDKITTVTAVKMVREDYGILQPIISRDFLLKCGVTYKSRLSFAEDYVFLLDCLIQGAKMVIYPKALYYYRQRAGSITQTEAASTRAQFKVLVELTEQQPYVQFPEIQASLQTRLKVLSLALEDIQMREMFRQRRLFAAVSVIVNNPYMLVTYLRNIKRKVIR